MIDGTKMFITNAGIEISGLVTITARTGADEISNIVVENGTAGYTPVRASAQDGLALVGHPRAQLRRLPRARGQSAREPRGSGFHQFLEILDGGRISRGGAGPGLRPGRVRVGAQRTHAPAEQFGRPIASFQAIPFKLADMATEIEAARNLVYKAAWLKDEGRPFAQTAAMAKLYTGELSRRVCNEAVQIHGGLRVHGRVRRQPFLPRPEGAGDRRGHQ